MKTRLNAFRLAPEQMTSAADLAASIKADFGLEARFIHLINLRSSQINGCAYCVDMHCKEARADGMGQQWIDLIAVWRETPIYDGRERAVLAWAEALTNVSQTGAPDVVFDGLGAHFSDREILGLTMQASMINFWNRIAVGLRNQHAVDARAAA